MHGLKEISKMVEKNSFMSSLDIKDVYYLNPVHESSQKYLKFIWKEQLYQFYVLPNGLSPCPRWFTKLLKPPLAELRKSKHDISAYIDDIYLEDDTKENCTTNIIDTDTLLRSLGFKVHAEKSQFLPTQELDILGFTINSVNMTVLLKTEKKEQLPSLIRKTINKKFIKIRKLAQIIWKIVAALPAPDLVLYTREDWTKISCTVYKNTELTWWQEYLPNMFNKISEDPPTPNIYSDESDTGWLADFEGRNTVSNWSLERKYDHINVKEMLALYIFF